MLWMLKVLTGLIGDNNLVASKKSIIQHVPESTVSTGLTEPFVAHMYRWDFPTIN